MSEVPTVNIKPAYRISEFCRDFGVGRTVAYQEIAARRLRAYKVGKVTFIAGEDALAWRDAKRRQGFESWRDGNVIRSGA